MSARHEKCSVRHEHEKSTAYRDPRVSHGPDMDHIFFGKSTTTRQSTIRQITLHLGKLCLGATTRPDTIARGLRRLFCTFCPDPTCYKRAQHGPHDSGSRPMTQTRIMTRPIPTTIFTTGNKIQAF